MYINPMSLKEMGLGRSVEEYLDLLEGPKDDELLSFEEEEFFQEEKEVEVSEDDRRKQARYNVYAGFLRHRIYKAQGGKNPVYFDATDRVYCDSCGEKLELLTKDEEDFAEENVRALLNLYDWAGYCSYCGCYTYGYIKAEDEELTESLEEPLETEVLPVPELVAATEEISEELPKEILSVEDDSSITDSDPEISPIEELRKMKYVELAALANGRIPNFRRMKKEELILSLGGSEEEKVRVIERVRLETKRRYGSLKDKEEEVPTPIVSPENQENLVRFQGGTTPIEALRNNIQVLKERALSLLKDEQTTPTQEEVSEFPDDWEKFQMTIFDYLEE